MGRWGQARQGPSPGPLPAGRRRLRDPTAAAHHTVPNAILPRDPMNTAAIATMVLIGGFIWGGLILITVTALRKERGKEEAD